MAPHSLEWIHRLQTSQGNKNIWRLRVAGKRSCCHFQRWNQKQRKKVNLSQSTAIAYSIIKKIKSGRDLLFRGLTPQVPSALESLTSVFGMGTGVASPLYLPENCERWSWRLKNGHLLRWPLRFSRRRIKDTASSFTSQPSPYLTIFERRQRV